MREVNGLEELTALVTRRDLCRAGAGDYLAVGLLPPDSRGLMMRVRHWHQWRDPGRGGCWFGGEDQPGKVGRAGGTEKTPMRLVMACHAVSVGCGGMGQGYGFMAAAVVWSGHPLTVNTSCWAKAGSINMNWKIRLRVGWRGVGSGPLP